MPSIESRIKELSQSHDLSKDDIALIKAMWENKDKGNIFSMMTFGDCPILKTEDIFFNFYLNGKGTAATTLFSKLKVGVYNEWKGAGSSDTLRVSSTGSTTGKDVLIAAYNIIKPTGFDGEVDTLKIITTAMQL